MRVCRAADTFYLVAELMEGGELFEKIIERVWCMPATHIYKYTHAHEHCAYKPRDTDSGQTADVLVEDTSVGELRLHVSTRAHTHTRTHTHTHTIVANSPLVGCESAV